ncbi:MAG TPA: hypothetical protein VHN14_36185 [Kofleriaceae bacterium]|jgi:hypothetical protein|nr:hypothetical protein [Kofleriaceae bacterium]
MSKVTFHGLPAWVGAILGPTICELWNRDPTQLHWDRTLLHTVDLAMTPSAAVAGRITVPQIEVDDHTGSGGRTTIGPMWPGGAAIGACWFSDNCLARLGLSAKSRLPVEVDGHDYEYMTIQYFNGEQGNRRFYGFHANLLQVQNQLSLVEIWNPGTGAGSAKSAGAWWLDLTAAADPNTPRLAPKKPAALFLEVGTVRTLRLFEPKIPPSVGTFVFSSESP